MTRPDYVGFARWCIQEGSWAGTSLDGGEIQDAALRFGIIKQEPYCPEKHGDNDVSAERGDDWFVFTERAE
jgi:hypothetical protein